MCRNLSRAQSDKTVVAIVLAAGESRRMGTQNKLTLPVDGRPMVAQVVDAFERSRVKRVLVITGHEPQRIREALEGCRVELLHNPDYVEGIASSIRAGIGALDDGVDAAIVALADMPWVGSQVIDRLVDAYRAARELTIFIPMFGNKRGNPVLWGSQHFPELLGLRGDVGGQALFDRNSEAIGYVDVESPGVNVDVDTPEALRALGIGEGSDSS
ncbi:MAG: nucleotidyltransferase family protein [Myxococcales bacterium]|jgi:molybdenum cofactor cytidylyltransferase